MSWKEGISASGTWLGRRRKKGRRWEPWKRKRERDRWGLRSGAELLAWVAAAAAAAASFRPHCGGGGAARCRSAPTNIFVRSSVRSIRKYFAKVQSNKVIGEREGRRRREGGADSSSFLSRRPRSVWFGLREKSGDTAAPTPTSVRPSVRPSISMSSSTDDRQHNSRRGQRRLAHGQEEW